MVILDTNVVSETMKPEPSHNVMKWLSERHPSEVFLTAITEAEVLTGIALLPAGRRRNLISTSWETMLEQLYRDRILPFDRTAAREFAHVVTARRRAGRPISAADAQIAAIARSHSASLAT